MPTRDVDESFWDDYDRLSAVQQHRFLTVGPRCLRPVLKPRTQLIATRYSSRFSRVARPDQVFFFGTPFGWQSRHFTKWMLCGLWVDLNVVSIFSTSRPQFDRRGWQLAQVARVRML